MYTPSPRSARCPDPHPSPVQLCVGTPPHSHPAPPQGHGQGPPGCWDPPQSKDQAPAAGAGERWPGTRGAGGTGWQRVRPYGFMLKKSLMPSGLTGLLLLFFSATDFSLVQVRCTFSGAVSASSPGVELLEKVVAFLSWMSWTCGEQRVRVGRSRGQTPARAASWQSPSPPPPASPRRRPPAPQGRSGAGACWPGSCAGWSRGTRP